MSRSLRESDPFKRIPQRGATDGKINTSVCLYEQRPPAGSTSCVPVGLISFTATAAASQAESRPEQGDLGPTCGGIYVMFSVTLLFITKRKR